MTTAQADNSQLIERGQRLTEPSPEPTDDRPVYRPAQDDPGEWGRRFSRWTIEQSRKAGNPF